MWMKVFSELINLFFVPAISVYIMYNRKQISDNVKMVLLYVVMVVANTIIGDVLGTILNKILGLDFSREGVKYGFMAIIIAIAIPYIVEIWKASINLNLEITKKNEK